MKYHEGEYVAELLKYIESTYEGHYVGEDNVQALDLIFAAGHGEGFCIGDILKYASRYGKKDGYNRKDLIKILHYGILMLYVHDKEHAPIIRIANTHTVPLSQAGYARSAHPPDEFLDHS